MGQIRRMLQDPSCILAESMGDLQYLRDKYGAGVVGNPQPVESPYGKALSLDGTDDKIVIGAKAGTVKTVMMKVYLETTTEQLLDFDSGTNDLSAAAGTLSVSTLADEVIYVDGVATATIAAGAWKTVAFTTATGLAISNLQVGTDNTNFGQVRVAGVVLFTRVLSTREINNYHTGQNFEYMNNLILHLDMSDINPQNLAPRTVGTLNGTGVGLDASTDIVPGVSDGMGTEYNGVDERTIVSDASILRYTPTQPKTISCFFKLNDVIGFQTIIGKWGSGVNTKEYVAYMNTTNLILSVNAVDPLFTIAGFEPGILYFLAYTLDASGNVEIFIDSVSRDTGSAATFQTVLTENFQIGSGITTSNPLNGMVDESMIFDSAFTQLQVIDLERRIRMGRL